MVFGSHLVDGALQALGLPLAQPRARLFCPQIVADTGAKLSKSLIRERHGARGARNRGCSTPGSGQAR